MGLVAVQHRILTDVEFSNDEDCEYDEVNVESDEDVDDESNGDLDVQANGHASSFQTFNQVLENG